MFPNQVGLGTKRQFFTGKQSTIFPNQVGLETKRQSFDRCGLCSPVRKSLFGKTSYSKLHSFTEHISKSFYNSVEYFLLYFHIETGSIQVIRNFKSIYSSSTIIISVIDFAPKTLFFPVDIQTSGEWTITRDHSRIQLLINSMYAERTIWYLQGEKFWFRPLHNAKRKGFPLSLIGNNLKRKIF